MENLQEGTGTVAGWWQISIMAPERNRFAHAAQRGSMSDSPQKVSRLDRSTGEPGPSHVTSVRRSRPSALALVLFGFAAGTIFWGALGETRGLALSTFGPTAPEQTSAIPVAAHVKPSDRLSDLPFRALNDAVAENCTTLVLDRTTRVTRPGQCPADGSGLAYAPSSGRGDLMRTVD